MIAHTIDSYLIPSQNKRKLKLETYKQKCQNYRILQKKITINTTSVVAW